MSSTSTLAPPGPLGGRVEAQVAGLEHGRALPGAAAQQRPQPRQQHRVRERLGEVVVGAVVQRLDLVPLALLGGQHEDRGPDPLAAQGRAEPVAVDAGQHDVQHDHVVGVLPGHPQPVGAVQGDVDREPLGGQPVAEPGGQPPLVLHHQHPHPGPFSCPGDPYLAQPERGLNHPQGARLRRAVVGVRVAVGRRGGAVADLGLAPGDPGRPGRAGGAVHDHDPPPAAAAQAPLGQARGQPPDHGPGRGQQQQDPGHVGEEPGSEQERPGQQDHGAVGHLDGGDPRLGQGELEPPPGGQPLPLGQPGAGHADHQEQEQRRPQPDDVADGDQHRQLGQRDHDEGNGQDGTHAPSMDPPGRVRVAYLAGRGSRLGGRGPGSPGSRKVRPPQGRVLANRQSGRPAGQCHREQTAAPRKRDGKGETVR